MKKVYYTKQIIGLIAIILLLAGCGSDQTATPQSQEKTTENNQPDQIVASYALTEVAQHNNNEDCWLAIDGSVYDVTSFISRHPGGQAILQGCGQDATALYETRPMGSGTPHSQKARNSLSNFFIGTLKQ